MFLPLMLSLLYTTVVSLHVPVTRKTFVSNERECRMPFWICSQEKAHVPGEIYQRRELSARAALFCGWWEYKLD